MVQGYSWLHSEFEVNLGYIVVGTEKTKWSIVLVYAGLSFSSLASQRCLALGWCIIKNTC